MGFREIAPNSARRFDIPARESYNPPVTTLTSALSGGE